MTWDQDAWVNSHALSKPYFALAPAYAEALGRLRWSSDNDWLTLSNNVKVATYEDLAQFLEGFVSRRQLLAFATMAHWAVLLSIDCDDRELSRLRKAFLETGQNWRNAGALTGMISELLLPAADPPDVKLLCARLRDSALPIRWFAGTLNGKWSRATEPPHALVDFEQHVRQELVALSDEDLRQWLTFGRGPVRQAGEDLARELPPPQTLGDLIEELLSRPRLAGAAAHVPQMVLALSVPPRRRSPELLPVGGYADVITHGSVDRLLPSQHALDDLEFLRRLSENELLFFRREEPPAQSRQELAIILDQGIRTWGDVRLVLTAAALALVKHVDKRSMPYYLFLTSRPGAFEDLLGDSDVGPALEASDFTRNPGLALERALERLAPLQRDLLLLTHPFSLMEEDVQAAARRLAPHDRLFALTVNARGEAELVQLRGGLPVRLKSFRVDLVPSVTSAAEPANPGSSWSGDIEPILWPFRFGPDRPIAWCDFDFDGRRLLAVTESSMLWLWDLNNSEMEILPRPQIGGEQVFAFHGIKGVTGGFALLGSQDSRYVIVHYDCAKRRCTLHQTGLPIRGVIGLAYVSHCHCAVLFRHDTLAPVMAIDLETKGIARSEDSHSADFGEPAYLVNVGMQPQQITGAGRSSQRAEQALRYVEEAGPGLSEALQVTGPDQIDEKLSTYFVNSDGSLAVCDRGKPWSIILPYTDGKATLQGAKVREARLANSTLAMHYMNAMKLDVLAFFRGPSVQFLRELPWYGGRPGSFVLSNDGAKVAFLRGSSLHLEVQHTDRPERILLTRAGGFHNASQLWVGEDALLLRCGRKGHTWHLFVWRDGHLQVHSETRKYAGDLAVQNFRNNVIREFASTRPLAAGDKAPTSPDDPGRWRQGAERHGVVFLLDQYGQGSVFNRAGALVFQFFGHGDSWSAWLPDGTRYGRGRVHTWPNAPGAPRAMGQALQRACGGPRR